MNNLLNIALLDVKNAESKQFIKDHIRVLENTNAFLETENQGLKQLLTDEQKMNRTIDRILLNVKKYAVLNNNKELKEIIQNVN